ILHAASHWPGSRIPVVLGFIGALLTAFYMTRQVCYVFFGEYRGGGAAVGHGHDVHNEEDHSHSASHSQPHESPSVMTMPLVILAVFAVLLGFVGTPFWPGFSAYIEGHHPENEFRSGALILMAISTVIVVIGIASGWSLYGRRSMR